MINPIKTYTIKPLIKILAFSIPSGKCSIYNSLLILSFLLSTPAFPQFSRLNFDTYTTQEGLSENVINCLYQDKTGRLWIGTEDGLNYFDGREFNVCNAPIDAFNSLRNKNIHAIAEDANNQLWLGTLYSGVLIYNKTTRLLTGRLTEGHSNKSLIDNRINCLLADAKFKQVWVGTKAGLSVANTGTNNNTAALLQGQSINCLTLLPIGQLLVGTSNGIYVVDAFKHTVITHITVARGVQPKPGNNDIVNAIANAGNNSWLIATSNGLWKLQKNNTGEAFLTWPINIDNDETGPETKAVNITAIVNKAAGEFWLGIQEKGLTTFNLLNKQTSIVNNGPFVTNKQPFEIINCFLTDTSGGTWIGSQAGLNYYHPKNNRFQSLKPTEGYFTGIKGVFSIYTDDDTIILLGTKNGLYQYNEATRQYTKASATSADYYYCFLKQKGLPFLAGTSAGLKELVQTKNNYLVKNAPLQGSSILNNARVCCIKSFEDSLLLFGTKDAGLYTCNLITHTWRHLFNDSMQKQLPDNLVHDIAIGKDGNVFLAHENGITKINLHTGVKHFYEVDPGRKDWLTSKSIFALIARPDTLWAASNGGGIFMLLEKQNIFKRVSELQGLANNAVYCIVADADNRIWSSTNFGICMYNISNGNIINFDRSDGLQDNEFNSFASYKSSNYIYFGGVNGVSRFSPSSFSFNKTNCNIVINRITVHSANGRLRYVEVEDSAFSIKFNENIVELNYNASDFIKNTKHQYSYRVVGFNSNWIDLKYKNDLTLMNLAPGHYTLEIRATSNDGFISSNIKKIYINVVPAYWQTITFKLLISILVAALFFAGFRFYYINKIRIQKSIYESKMAVEKERERISAEIHDDIGAGLSSVKLQLALLGHKFAKDEVKKDMDKIDRNMTDLTEKIREVIWSLDTSNDNLENLVYYIHKIAADIFNKTDIALTFDIDPTLPEINISGEKRRNIYLIVKEAVYNIKKHSRATYASVKIWIAANELNIEISDNGVGFSLQTSPPGRYGLKNMRNRAIALNAQYNITSVAGTKISIKIPLSAITNKL